MVNRGGGGILSLWGSLNTLYKILASRCLQPYSMLDNSDITPCYTDRDVVTSDHDQVNEMSGKNCDLISISQSSQFSTPFY